MLKIFQQEGKKSKITQGGASVKGKSLMEGKY